MLGEILTRKCFPLRDFTARSNIIASHKERWTEFTLSQSATSVPETRRGYVKTTTPNLRADPNLTSESSCFEIQKTVIWP